MEFPNASLPFKQAIGLTAEIRHSSIAPSMSSASFNMAATIMDNSTMDYACVSITPDAQVLVSHMVFVFFSILFVVVGIVGNTISMMVFSSANMRVVSSNVYLWVLSVSDTCYLITILFSKILPTIRCIFYPQGTFDVINKSNATCKLLQYFADLFSDYSACLILAFTVERFFACYHAVWFRQMCTVRRARLLCFLIFAEIAIFIAPYHFLYMGLYKEYNVCTVIVEHEKKFTILYIIEFMLYRIIPVFVIAGLNFLIITKVTELSRKKSRRRSGAIVNNKPYGGLAPSKEDRHIQLTTLLLVVSSCYVILYFPVLIHFLIWWLHRLNVVKFSDDSLIIAQNYTRILYVMGFAINFFLYTLSGRIFREQLKCMVCTTKKVYQEINNMTLEETTANVTNINTSTSPNSVNTKL